MVTPELQGAFTGGISPLMLKSIGSTWALAGHSERRTINMESDEYINAQCLKLIENDMNVILCIGETLEEFEKNLVESVCEIQLKKGLKDVSPEDMSKVTMYVLIRVFCGELCCFVRLVVAHIIFRRHLALTNLYGLLVPERLLHHRLLKAYTRLVVRFLQKCTEKPLPMTLESSMVEA